MHIKYGKGQRKMKCSKVQPDNHQLPFALSNRNNNVLGCRAMRVSIKFTPMTTDEGRDDDFKPIT